MQPEQLSNEVKYFAVYCKPSSVISSMIDDEYVQRGDAVRKVYIDLIDERLEPSDAPLYGRVARQQILLATPRGTFLAICNVADIVCASKPPNLHRRGSDRWEAKCLVVCRR